MPEDEKKAAFDQMEALAKLQDGAIAKTKERNNNILDRLQGWEDYHRAQDQILVWLREAEKAKSGLNPKHVKVKEVDSLLKKIQVTFLFKIINRPQT